MKKIKLLSILLIVLLLTTAMMVGCKGDAYEILDFSINIVDGETTHVFNKAAVGKMKAVEVSTTTTNSKNITTTKDYVAFSLKEIFAKFNISNVEKIKAIASDNYEVNFLGTQIADMYVGVLLKTSDGKYAQNADDKVQIFDKRSTSANETAKKSVKVVVNYVDVVIPDPIAMVTVTGNGKTFTISDQDIATITQETMTITVKSKSDVKSITCVGFKLSSLIALTKFDGATFTKCEASATDITKEATFTNYDHIYIFTKYDGEDSFRNAYITGVEPYSTGSWINGVITINLKA